MAINNGMHKRVSPRNTTHTASLRAATMGARRRERFCFPPETNRGEAADRTKKKDRKGRPQNSSGSEMAIPSHMYMLGIDLKQETNRQGAEKNSKASAA